MTPLLPSAARCQRLGATIRVHADQEKNSSSAVEELHSIKTASVMPQSLCESFSPHSKVNIFNLAKNAGTSVDQIERFYARNLPLSRGMAINLQSFDDGDVR